MAIDFNSIDEDDFGTVEIGLDIDHVDASVNDFTDGLIDTEASGSSFQPQEESVGNREEKVVSALQRELDEADCSPEQLRSKLAMARKVADYVDSRVSSTITGRTVVLREDGSYAWTCAGPVEQDGGWNAPENEKVKEFVESSDRVFSLLENGRVHVAYREDAFMLPYRNIDRIYLFMNTFYALGKNGKVYAASSDEGRYIGSRGPANTENWENVHSVLYGDDQRSICLHFDGTMSCTDTENGSFLGLGSLSCIAEWNNIRKIVRIRGRLVGIRWDGNLVATELVNKSSDSPFDFWSVMKDWCDIVDIIADTNHVVGLTGAGDVLMVSCEQGNGGYDPWEDVARWKNVAKLYISEEQHMYAGLLANGELVCTNYFGRADQYTGQEEIDSWHNLAGLKMTPFSIVGVRKDGSLVVHGKNIYGECNVSHIRMFQNFDSIAARGASTWDMPVADTDTEKVKKIEYQKYLCRINAEIDAKIRERIAPFQTGLVSKREEIENEFQERERMHFDKIKIMMAERNDLEYRLHTMPPFAFQARTDAKEQLENMDIEICRMERIQKKIALSKKEQLEELEALEKKELDIIKAEVWEEYPVLSYEEFEAQMKTQE